MPKKNDNIRKLTRTGRGGSLAIVIPADHVKSLRWRERQRLIVKRIPHGVAIVDAKTKKGRK